MRRPETVITLTTDERESLEGLSRVRTAPHRSVQRAQLVLLAAGGMANTAIAKEVGLSRATVVEWRRRFAHTRLAGLTDRPRPGAVRRYDKATERRILAQLDRSPPEGHATWTGKLVAEALGDVPPHQVWSVLRKHGIHLQRRRSWCLSTDPEFTQKAADIVGLYLDPPDNGVVLSVDEKPAIQALERAQGWLRLPNGQALRGFSHEYKRHGTTTLFAALEVATGMVRTGHYSRRRRREFLQFMNGMVSHYPDKELHVILDNLSTHKPKHDQWLARHPRVHFHYTPTHASWLNQIECWFSILARRALKGLSATSVQDVCRAIDAFTQTYNHRAAPFQMDQEDGPSWPPPSYSHSAMAALTLSTGGFVFALSTCAASSPSFGADFDSSTSFRVGLRLTVGTPAATSPPSGINSTGTNSVWPFRLELKVRRSQRDRTPISTEGSFPSRPCALAICSHSATILRLAEPPWSSQATKQLSGSIKPPSGSMRSISEKWSSM